MTTYEYIAFTKETDGDITTTYPPAKELLNAYKQQHPGAIHPQALLNWLGNRGWRLLQILKNELSWSYWLMRASDRRCQHCEEALEEMDAAGALVGAS